MMRRIASISLDLDNKWSYMRAQDIGGWNQFPTYLPQVVPKILRVMDELGITLTIFVVGRDAEIDVNIPWIEQLVTNGHDIGNHSYLHEPWLHEQSIDVMLADIAKAEGAIQAATGQKTVAFRGPGFAVSKNLLRMLQHRGYLYDASVFPTFLAPIIQRASLRNTNHLKPKKERKNQPFGKFSDGFRCLGPHLWSIDGSEILEIPVTTMPIFRVPIHFTYLHFLAQKSISLAKLYCQLSLVLCWLLKVQPSILLHPLDFLGADQVPELEHFPGMGQKTEKKCELTVHFLKEFQKRYQVLSLSQYAMQTSKHSLKAFLL